MNDQAIEQEIQAKGKTAPRVTPADIEANIASEYYFTAAEGTLGRIVLEVHREGETIDLEVEGLTGKRTLDLLTFCVLVLRNGFTVTGESACASPENFDAEIGRNIARQNAVQKIWPLMGYALKQQLHEQAIARTQPAYDVKPTADREQALEELVRSACAIAERKGAGTAWDRFTASARALGLNGVTARTYRILPSDEQ